MIREDKKQAVREFLKLHPEPALRTATTLRDGFVTCIKPIPTICGAELICNPKDLGELKELVEDARNCGKQEPCN